MADEQNTTTAPAAEDQGAGTQDSPPQAPQTDEAQQIPPTETDGTEDAQSANDERHEDALPEWARAELANVRKEAARYRVAARELREALEKAKSPEEYEAASARVAELETELHRERLARAYGLPEGLASRITGTTDEEREADARQLAELFNSRTIPRGRGGLNPSQKPADPSDPAALARLIPRGRH